MGSTPSTRCSPDFAHVLPVEPKKPCETFPAPSSQILNIPSPPHANSFVQTLVDCGLGDISSSHLQLLLRPVTDMRTVPHLAAQPGQQNVCKRHSERRPPAGSPLAERLHWALQHGPSRARTSRARCADHRGERSCASRWRRSFSLSVQSRVYRAEDDCRQHPLFDDSLCGRCLLSSDISQMEGAKWQTVSSGTHLSPMTWARQ